MKVYLGNKHHIAAYLASVHEFGAIPEDVIHFSARASSFHVIFWKLLGFSTARYWTGNDAWRYKNDWTYRIRAKIINRFFDTHYFLGPHLAECLYKFPYISEEIKDGAYNILTNVRIRNVKTKLCYKNQRPGPRKKNKKPVIAYYHCEQTFPGRYGLKTIEKLCEDLGDRVAWMPIYPGSYKFDEMEDAYRKMDVLVRPSFWDGWDPFMVREAAHFGVLCVSTWSQDPSVARCDPYNYIDVLDKVREAVEKVETRNNKQP